MHESTKDYKRAPFPIQRNKGPRNEMFRYNKKKTPSHLVQRVRKKGISIDGHEEKESHWCINQNEILYYRKRQRHGEWKWIYIWDNERWAIQNCCVLLGMSPVRVLLPIVNCNTIICNRGWAYFHLYTLASWQYIAWKHPMGHMLSYLYRWWRSLYNTPFDGICRETSRIILKWLCEATLVV